MTIVLGLDVSTNCTGYSVLSSREKGEFELLKIGHIDTSKQKDIWEKLDLFKEEISKEIDFSSIDECYIEEALISFHAGASNPNTITKLVMFNALVSNYVRDNLGKNVHHIPSQTARKLCGIKVQSRKKSGKPVKIQTFEQVTMRILPDLIIDLTRTGKPKPYMLDRVDSFVVGRAGLLIVENDTTFNQ